MITGPDILTSTEKHIRGIQMQRPKTGVARLSEQLSLNITSRELASYRRNHSTARPFEEEMTSCNAASGAQRVNSIY
jgi:hypothetical protein